MIFIGFISCCSLMTMCELVLCDYRLPVQIMMPGNAPEHQGCRHVHTGDDLRISLIKGNDMIENMMIYL
jgi:hypothetical protein